MLIKILPDWYQKKYKTAGNIHAISYSISLATPEDPCNDQYYQPHCSYTKETNCANTCSLILIKRLTAHQSKLYSALAKMPNSPRIYKEGWFSKSALMLYVCSVAANSPIRP